MINKLAETYARLVKYGKITLDEVPEKYREAVREIIKREG